MPTATTKGGVSSSGDIAPNSVESTDILDGQILNADISASAAIDDGKLAEINDADKVSGAAFKSLSSIPAGAGVIPAANVPTPTAYEIRIPMLGTAHNPADSTTYIIPTTPSVPPGTSFSVNDATGRVYVAKTGTIKSAMFHAEVGTGFGSAQTFTYNVRINNATNYDLVTGCEITTYNNVFTATGLSIAVTAGDLLEFFYDSPVWATNPTGIRYSFAVYIA